MSEPISPEYIEKMNHLAQLLDKSFNPDVANRETGFVLLVFPFGVADGARTNYISNGKRADILVLLKEMVARFEGQPEVKGRG